MNAAARAFVRLALTRGYGVLGIHYGFEGLLSDQVRITYCFKNLYTIIIPEPNVLESEFKAIRCRARGCGLFPCRDMSNLSDFVSCVV